MGPTEHQTLTMHCLQWMPSERACNMVRFVKAQYASRLPSALVISADLQKENRYGGNGKSAGSMSVASC
eukprot:3061206-Amphidinium_carterae.1